MDERCRQSYEIYVYAQNGTVSFETLQSMYQTTRCDERSASPPSCFILDEKLPRTHRIRRWVGPISGLDALHKRKRLALPATAHQILRCPAVILGTEMIKQSWSGIEVYAVFCAPIKSDGPCCIMKYIANFLYNFRKYTWFSNKAVNLNPFSRFGFSRTLSNSPVHCVVVNKYKNSNLPRWVRESLCFAPSCYNASYTPAIHTFVCRPFNSDRSCEQPSCTPNAAAWDSPGSPVSLDNAVKHPSTSCGLLKTW
jgi:hypothetical protein